MATHNQYQKVVPFIIFILALILLFNLIKPMISIILGSILFSYLSFPLHKRINKKIVNESFSIILSMLIIVIIILIPLSFLAFEVTQQGYSFYSSFSDNLQKGALFGIGCTSLDSKVCLLINQAERFSAERLSRFGFDKQLKNLLPILENKVTSFVMGLPVFLAKFFITLILSFFILKDWRAILKKIVYLLPMRTTTKNKLTEQFRDIAHTVIYAQLFVAAVQGFLGTIGFYLAGVPFPIVLGIVLAFCALIPAIGTAIIWLPASLYLILSGYFTQNYWVMGKGIGLFFYGLFIISTIDNILLATIVRAKTKVNQMMVIIGVIGGAAMFGFIGIFIGPILLPLLVTYFETFKERFR